MKTLEIMILEEGKHTNSIQVTQSEWESINYVDYIELDAKGNLHPDFASHGEIVCNRMRALLAKRNTIDALDKLIRALEYLRTVPNPSEFAQLDAYSILWRAYHDIFNRSIGAQTVRSYHRIPGLIARPGKLRGDR